MLIKQLFVILADMFILDSSDHDPQSPYSPRDDEELNFGDSQSEEIDLCLGIQKNCHDKVKNLITKFNAG